MNKTIRIVIILLIGCLFLALWSVFLADQFGYLQILTKNTPIVSNAQKMEATPDPQLLIGRYEIAQMDGSEQKITSALNAYYYPILVMQAGVSFTWQLNAEKNTLNFDNNQVIMPEFEIDQILQVGTNQITFTPESIGIFPYSCWAGSINSSVYVVHDLKDLNMTEIEALAALGEGDCCN